jgi:hypothetical protein
MDPGGGILGHKICTAWVLELQKAPPEPKGQAVQVFDRLLGGFWAHFEAILAPFLHHFFIVFSTSFLDAFLIILGSI